MQHYWTQITFIRNAPNVNSSVLDCMPFILGQICDFFVMWLPSLQVREHLPIYAGGIQEFQNRLDHLQIEQAKLAETLASDKRYSLPSVTNCSPTQMAVLMLHFLSMPRLFRHCFFYCLIVAAVNLDKKQNCFLFFVNVTIKNIFVSLGEQAQSLTVASWVCGVWPLTSCLPQLSEDGDAAAEDNGNSSALPQRQNDWQYGFTFLGIYTLLLFLHMFKLTIPPCFLYLSTELAYNDEQIHKFEKWVCDVLLTLPVKDVILSSPVICLSLFHPRLHLSAHIKRVKSLLKDDCVQRYKELLASTRTWSRSEPPLESFSHVKQSSESPPLPTTTTIYSQWDNCLLDVMMEAYMEISTGL